MSVTEKQLLKVCISTAMIGLCMLFIYSNLQTFEVTKTLEDTKNDQTVKLQGTVIKYTNMENLSFITIANQKIETTPVILFKDREIYLHEGDYVEITGTVETYKGEKELIASVIEIKGR